MNLSNEQFRKENIMSDKLSLSTESASALREFAEAIPNAIENISQSTDKLAQVYQSVSESVGPHGNEFADMIMSIKKVQEDAKDAINVLPKLLKETADKIDAFVAKKPKA